MEKDLSLKPSEVLQRNLVLQLGRVDILRDLILLLILIGIGIFFSFLSPFFLTVQNFINIGLAITTIGIAAIGATIVLVSGGLDLTVGSVIGLSVIVVGALLTAGFPVFAAILGTLGVGLFVGGVNGFLVVKGRINPLIATLGMMSVIRGFAFVYSEGISHAIVAEGYGFLSRGRWVGIPVPIIMLGVLYITVWAIMKYTDFGQYIYSIGGNANAARLAGVGVDAIRYKVYMLGAGFSTIAGLFLASRLGASLPQAGTGTELTVIAAVILGGTSLSGGVGTVLGTLLGVLIMGTLDNGFTLLNVSAFHQMIARGSILIIAVFIDQFRTGGYE